MNLKLGKRIGVVHDPRTIHLRDVLTALPQHPPSTELARGVEVPVFANDRYGDCTCAAMGHRIVMQQHRARQTDAPPLTDDDVLAVYSAVTGFNPNNSWSDQGAYLIDVLRYMRRFGMGREDDGSRHTIGAYVKVDHSDRDQVKLAAWMFGGLYVGAELPTDAESQFEDGKVWAPTSSDHGGAPGSWGGHCMHMDGYSSGRVGFRTWGRRQRASWSWWDEYVDETWALVSEDYLTGKGRSPQGFDAQALQDAIGKLG